MQNTMLDSTVSCTPSTLNFVCDVDGVHTEIPIPSSAWDFENETVWLTQAQLAELYKTSVQNVGHHIGNILDDDELQADSTIKESFIVQLEGNREVSREVKLYNLEMLIALGYRIKSKVATKFRQWATKHLKELMTKGHTEIETQHQHQHQFTIPKTFPEALRAYADEVERREAAERRAITAEAELTSEKEAHEKDNEDFRNGFDIVNAQKAQISSTREATAMATASSAKAHQRFAEKVLETHASELVALRAVVDEQRSQLWDANRTAHDIYKLNVLKKEYSLNTLQNKARELLSHFATKLGKRPTPLPNGATYPDSLGRLQPSISTYYEKDVVDAVLNWVIENTNKFAHIGGKRDPLREEW